MINRLITVHYDSALVADGKMVTRRDDPSGLDGLPYRPPVPDWDLMLIPGNYISKRNWHDRHPFP
jgi:hypothetical protein